MGNDKEPQFATQLDAYGKFEKVDITKQCVKVLCSEPGCFNVRYIHPQDRTQTTRCKPCSRVARLKSRARRAREGRKARAAAKDHYPIMVGGVGDITTPPNNRQVCGICSKDWPCRSLVASKTKMPSDIMANLVKSFKLK